LGIIEKQTIRGTIYTYIGVILGVITNIFLFAWFFTPEQVGLLSVILSYATLFSQLGNLGLDSITVRLFPWFRSQDKKHHGYAFIMILVGTLGSVLIIISFYFLKNLIINQGGEASGLLADYWFYIPITAVFLLFFSIFDTYSSMMYLTVRGTFLKEFLQRLLIICSIALFIFSIISFDFFVGLYFASISVLTVIIILMLIREKNIVVIRERGFIGSELKKSMFSVAGFGVLTVFSSSVMLNIDRIMIEKYVGLYEAGIYTVTYFFGIVLLLPSRSLGKIGSTFLAEAWKNNNVQIIRDIYYKSSLNQFLFSALLFAGIWVNIENVFCILPEKYEPGRWVIFWICFASLFEMISGVNKTILATSKYYRVFSVFMMIFVIVIIASNIILIPLFNITGAAIASALSTFLFVIVRWVFLWWKFGLQPFNISYLYATAFTLLAYFAGYLIPEIEPFWVDMLIRSGVVLIVFIIPVLYFGVSEDLNNKLKKVFNRYLIKK